MSWFKYSDQPKRALRKGIWLRTRNLPAPILKEIESNITNGESLLWVEVKELQKNGFVLLEIWCKQISKKEKYTVFHVSAKEDEDWICEGDLGRGFVRSHK